MTIVNIYLTFDGNCQEAFNFYRSVFGGEFSYIGRFGEMPQQEGVPPISEELKNKIMHVSLPISKETMLMGSDVGGNPEMPMADQFWGDYFGLFTDKFGINWMMSFNDQQKTN